MRRTGWIVLASLLAVLSLSLSVPAFAAPADPINVESPALNVTVKVLCDGKVFDGYSQKVFDLKTAEDQNPNVQKVIRNCVFRNSTQPAIVITNAKNVLIEGNTFENIRTNIPGVGVHAINIPCRSSASCSSGNPTDNITIRNNVMRYIGADGIQLGEENRYISNVSIQNNEFVGRADVGENSVDVKGVVGPIFITGNKVHGFRPCESPKKGGNQDCSGSPGEGIVIHDGGGATKTPATNVTVENNDVYDNVYGIVAASGVKNITIRGNSSHNNLKNGILVNSAYSVSITGNTLSNNPTHIKISNTPTSGGTCTMSGNIFSGSGTNLSLGSSTCK